MSNRVIFGLKMAYFRPGLAARDVSERHSGPQNEVNSELRIGRSETPLAAIPGQD